VARGTGQRRGQLESRERSEHQHGQRDPGQPAVPDGRHADEQLTDDRRGERQLSQCRARPGAERRSVQQVGQSPVVPGDPLQLPVGCPVRREIRGARQQFVDGFGEC
jgi:hypothetical protein